MATLLHLKTLPSLPPISAIKITNKIQIKGPFKRTKRKPKRKQLSLPKLPPAVKQLLFSFLPPPLNLLSGGGSGGSGGGAGGGGGGEWWFGKRRGQRLDLAEILWLLLTLSAGSVLGKETRVFELGISGLRNGAVCFVLGFVICFLICEGFCFGRKKRRRNWWANWGI